MKKIAIRGLVTLAVIVALCLFFSGTLHTITTAKVRMTKAKTGRFESELLLSGNLQWPETENLMIEGMNGEDTLIIRRLPVSAGAFVEEGGLIAECEVSSFDTRLETLQTSYAAKEKEKLELERKNSGLMLSTKEREWFAAYRLLQQAMSDTQTARQELRLAAWQAGVTLGPDDTLPEEVQQGKKTGSDPDETLSKGTEEEKKTGQGTDGTPVKGMEQEKLAALAEKLAEAEKSERDAGSALERLSRLSISEDVITYLERQEELEQEMSRLSEDMTALRILKVRSGEIRAPHAGYITALETKVGDQLTRESVLATMTAPETMPVIRLRAGENRRTLEPGTPVMLSAGDRTAEAVITGQSVQSDGGLWFEAEVSGSLLASLGGANVLTEENAVTGRVRWMSENATTLIPATALRGVEGDYYIFTGASVTTVLGAERITAERKNVTVLGLNDTVASIEESLKNDTILYLEDRTLTEGCEVMIY